jgi:hypothetical protein
MKSCKVKDETFNGFVQKKLFYGKVHVVMDLKSLGFSKKSKGTYEKLTKICGTIWWWNIYYE